MEAEVEVGTQAPAKNVGGRPKGSRTKNVSAEVALQSPEVQDLVAKTVAKAVERATQDLAEELAEARAKLGTVEGPSDMSTMRQLALAIAEINDQGANRKRVAPEIMEQRKGEFDRMNRLILEYLARDEMPTYELTRAVYLAEELVEPTYTDRDHVMRRTQIEWAGIPNEAMSPLNEPARAIHTAFMGWIGGPTPNVARAVDKFQARDQQSQSGLKVLHKPDVAQTPMVTRNRNAGVTRIGRRQAGDVVETNVLGTVAEPARQIA